MYYLLELYAAQTYVLYKLYINRLCKFIIIIDIFNWYPYLIFDAKYTILYAYVYEWTELAANCNVCPSVL